MSAVICKLPRAGLGNQLFPLMHAAVFAAINDLPLLVTGYRQFKIGPYFRREKSKRFYAGYFTFEQNLFFAGVVKVKAARLQQKLTVVHEPALEKLSATRLDGKVFVFEEMTTYHDYFGRLKPHRNMVLKLLFDMLSPAVLQQLAGKNNPTIGVHVRMGDFRKLAEGEQFRGGHVRTPLAYFIQLIEAIRQKREKRLSVTVFTDGRRQESEDLIKLGDVSIAQGNTDIVDLILLSRSKILILSTGSTFSAWAGFLSGSPLVKHPDHLHAPFRPGNINSHSYEGPYDATNESLANQIKSIS